MRLIRNVTFVVFLATFSWSIETGAFASSWQSWALEFDCSLQEDYPSQNQLSGTCNCDDPVEGCINVEHFCDNFAENACDDYCFQNTCGIADVTDCLVNSPWLMWNAVAISVQNRECIPAFRSRSSSGRTDA